MATQALLIAMTEYLKKERLFTAAKPGNSLRARLRDDLDRAAHNVEEHIAAYAEARVRPGAIRLILVAVDDSKPAEWAVDEAARMAEALDARISLVHVIDAVPVLAQEFAIDTAIKRPTLIDQGSALLHVLADRVPGELLAEQIVREGSADKQIIAAAQEIGAELIVIGTHGRGGLGRFLIGSVAEAVVRHATCPVLTVGHPRQGAVPEPYAIETAHKEADVAAAKVGA